MRWEEIDNDDCDLSDVDKLTRAHEEIISILDKQILKTSIQIIMLNSVIPALLLGLIVVIYFRAI